MAVKGKGEQNSIREFFWKAFGLLAATWILLLAATLGITLNQALDNLERKIEADLSATAVTLAESAMVQEAFSRGACDQALMDYLDSLLAHTEDLDIITIAGTDSVRLYHVEHDRIGLSFVGGDQMGAIAGERYFSDATGTMGLQRRYFCPVLGSDGEVRGFIMASTTMDRIHILRKDIVTSYCELGMVLLMATLVVCGCITLVLRRVFHGITPRRILQTYLTQYHVLNVLEEGVIFTDGKGRVQLTNQAAEQMLCRSDAQMEGLHLDELIRLSSGGSLLGQSRSNMQTSCPSVLASVVQGTGTQGATIFLTDRSEVMFQAEQLAGTRQMVAVLRDNNHEFMNRLQVISGLIQMDRRDEALEYIGSLAAVHAMSITPIIQRIENPNVAALLLGKLSSLQAKGIQMTLLSNSDLPRHSDYLSTVELVTVVGNLVENAIEAVSVQGEDQPRNIDIQITEDQEGLLLMVSDTGVGIREEDLSRVYDPGFSTKAPEGRGVGMSLVQDLVRRHSGTIEVDSEPGTGTTFTVFFHEKRQRG